jgi:hypothetical protein
MPEPQPTAVAEAPGFEDRWAKAKVVLVCLMTLFVLAGLAGVFGRGPVSRATAKTSESQALVTYERFAGRGTPGQMSLEFKQPNGPPLATLTLDPAVTDHMSITATQPRSSSESSSPAGATYGFQLGPDGLGKIVLSVQPFKAGPVRGALTINGERVPIQLMVWP